MQRLILLVILVTSLFSPQMGTAQEPSKGVIFAPSIDLHALVYTAPLSQWGSWVMPGESSRVVWLEGTAWLDYPSRIVIAAHTPGAFETIRDLAVGDAIFVTDMRLGISTAFYVTSLVVVEPDDIQWIMPTTPDQTLTLITCYGEDRLIVEATP